MGRAAPFVLEVLRHVVLREQRPAGVVADHRVEVVRIGRVVRVVLGDTDHADVERIHPRVVGPVFQCDQEVMVGTPPTALMNEVDGGLFEIHGLTVLADQDVGHVTEELPERRGPVHPLDHRLRQRPGVAPDHPRRPGRAVIPLRQHPME